jgi:hypothetical protein
MMSLDQYFEVLSAIDQSAGTKFLKTNSMTPSPAHPLTAANDDDDPIVLGSDGQPKTLAAAKELLIKSQERVSFLQKEVASLRAAAPTAPSLPVTLPKPPGAPAAIPGKTPTTSTSPSPPTSPAFSQADISTWSGKSCTTTTDFPPGCDSPKLISEYLSTLSTEALRGHLKGTATTDTARLQQKAVFNELKARK